MKLSTFLLVAAFSCSTAAVSLASPIDNFKLSDGTNVITFSLPSSPTPDQNVDLFLFTINNVAVDVNGTPANYFISFFNELDFGGLCITTDDATCFEDGSILNQTDLQLYTGSEAVPTFSLGTFSLTNVGVNTFSSNFTLDITSSETPIPEPSSLLMLSTGVLGLVCAVRRKLSV
jgi:PEP-CTERM motif